VVELSQNLYFIGVLLTYLLWGAMMKMRENRTRLMQLVLTMGVYFSAFARQLCVGQHVSEPGPVALHLSPDGHVAATLLGVHVHKGSRRYANGNSEGARFESMIAILISGSRS